MPYNLLPEGYEDEIITAEDLTAGKPVGYRNGSAFDYETGDYRRDGKNRIMDSDGIEAWKAWCINCMCTERYKHLAYSSDFGIELDKVFAAETREEAESILTRQIIEAIMADDYERCAYVESIEYEWPTPDSIRAHAILHGIEDVTIDVTAYITRNDN